MYWRLGAAALAGGFAGAGSGAGAMLADGELRRLAIAEVGDAGQSGLGDVRLGLAGEERLVGGDDDVGEGHEPGKRVVLDGVVGTVLEEVVGLLFVDVESGGADLAGLESVNEGGGVDELSSAGVDEDGAVLEEGDGVVPEQMGVFGSEGAVEGDDVAFAEERLEGDVGESEPCGVGAGEGVVGEKTHPEAL